MQAETTIPSRCAVAPGWASDCGRVVLYRADCRDILPHIKADAIITDPPYGMSWRATLQKHKAPSSINTAGGVYGREWGYIEGDREPFDPSHFINLGIPTVTWGANHYCNKLPVSPGWLIWDKKRGGSAGKGYKGSDCEMAWCSESGQSTSIFCYYWDGFRRDGEVGQHFHPTQKPVALMQWCIEATKIAAGATVCDPYMGSGTTGIACIRTGRKFIGIEKSPAHYQTALERIQRELSQGDLFLDSPNNVI